MRTLLRALACVCACCWMFLAQAAPAHAHAALASSEPGSGTQLERTPASVALEFTEEIDAGVSSIHVIDTNGKDHAASKARPDGRRLLVDVSALDRGVYTVTWKVLSKVDGHVTAGAFAFGVGVSPAGVRIADAQVPKTPGATPLSVVSRLAMYTGIVLMLGALVAAALVFEVVPRRTWTVVNLGALLILVGIVLLAESLRSDTGATYSALIDTKSGQGIIWRLTALAIASATVLLIRRRGLLFLPIAATIGLIATHVSLGHAGAGDSMMKIVAQTIHVFAAAVWIGGLAALLIGLPAKEVNERKVAARRFSTIAGVAIALVATTGTLRAINEIRSWEQLTHTNYGRAVIIKASLLIVLGLLGAINRFRNVPAADTTTRSLRRVGSLELAVALVVFATTGFLASTPPARVAAAAGVKPRAASLVVQGSDFATTLRARLEVTPGGSGPNRFELRLNDFDSHAPVSARRVELGFRFPAPDLIQSSRLELKRTAAGVYSASGSNLAIPGPWLVDVLVEQEKTSKQLTLIVPTVSRQQLQVTPGAPTLYNITFSSGSSVQMYLDPASSGANQIHVTYFDVGGGELSRISDVIIIATPSHGDPKVFSGRLLSPGHFVVDADLTAGKWRFDAIARGPQGEALNAYFEQKVSKKS